MEQKAPGDELRPFTQECAVFGVASVQLQTSVDMQGMSYV
jgi:hypothetical protein